MKTKKVKCRDVCCTSRSTDYTFVYDVYKVDLRKTIRRSYTYKRINVYYTFICRPNPTYEYMMQFE